MTTRTAPALPAVAVVSLVQRYVQAARLAERERCAAIAERLNAVWYDGWDDQDGRDFSWRLRHPQEFGDD